MFFYLWMTQASFRDARFLGELGASARHFPEFTHAKPPSPPSRVLTGGRFVCHETVKSLRSRLLLDPSGEGKPLRGRYGTIWSFRVGDLRVLYAFSDRELWVLVVRVGSRDPVCDDLPEG